MGRNNNTYVSTKQKIYIDTSTAMHYERLKKYVKQVKAVLQEANKKIIVLKEVWLELTRNLNSSDKNKSEAANQAISIISSHRDIFEIEDETVSQYEIEDAFADKALLARMILEKTDVSILLITNDRMLSKDALEINHQSSCYGYKISTSFLDYNGNLLPSFVSDDSDIDYEPEVVIKEVVNVVKVPVDREESWITKILAPIGIFIAGITIGKCSDSIVKILKNVA